MRLAFRTFIYGGLVWASVAFAVSRVGGGSVSNVDEGLGSLQIPAAFQQQTVIYPNGDVRMPGPIQIGGSPGGGFPQQEIINLYILRNQFPVLVNVTDRAVFTQHFLDLGWSSYPLADPCQLGFVLATASGYNLVVGWGNGQGVLLAGLNDPDVSQGIQMAAQSIELLPGACAWK